MKLFIDLFAPKKLEEYVLPERIIKQFQNGVYAHLLFFGNPGLGKSSLAKLLAKDHPCLYVNASEEGRIEVLRSEIATFCTDVQLNFEGKASDIKVVILDEIEGVSATFFDALRGFMDVYGKKVRFVATTNYINKVPAPILSRFECVDFGFASSEEEKFILEKYRLRLKAISIKGAKMEIADDALDFLVQKNFPDFRGALQDLQRLHVSGVKNITIDDIKTKSYEFKELYELIFTGDIRKPEQIHKILMGDYANKAMDVLQALDNNFIGYIQNNKADLIGIIPNVTVTVCKYQHMSNTVIDQALPMKACVFELMGIVAKTKMPKS